VRNVRDEMKIVCVGHEWKVVVLDIKKVESWDGCPDLERRRR